MTQIIAAICDGRKKVIALSDRMLTTRDLSLAFEHEEPKIEKITEHCVALTAGSALRHYPIFRAVRIKYANIARPVSIMEIAKAVKEEYQKARLEAVEDAILRPRGLTLESFYQMQRTLHDAVIMNLNREMERYNFDLHIVIAGVDDEGGHIYYITNPGIMEPFDALGFCCIGTGDRYADAVFAYRRYSPSIDLKRALFIAYEAKKESEMAGGIGPTTDIVIIDDKGVHKVPQQIIEQLDNIYREIKRKASYEQEVIKKIESLPDLPS